MSDLPLPTVRVLLVDDSPFERHFVPRNLHETGDVLITALAGSLQEARQQLQDWSHNFDAVILDVVLPDWSGLEDTQQIALEFKQAGKTVVIYTLHPYLEKLQKFRQQHQIQLVSKTSNCHDLWQALIKPAA